MLQMSVRRPPAFYLFYQTGFAQPVLHYRTVRASPASQQVRHAFWEERLPVLALQPCTMRCYALPLMAGMLCGWSSPLPDVPAYAC